MADEDNSEVRRRDEVWYSGGAGCAPKFEGNKYDQPVPFVIFDDFLVRDDLSALIEYTLDHERDFGASGVVDEEHLAGVVNPEYRRSLCLVDLGRHREVITSHIESSLARIFDELCRAPFPSRDIEAHIVASNDGEFFKRHSDNGCDNIRMREVTFVFYFHREPKAFEGGELRIYTSFVRAIMTRTPIRSETIAPLQNRMVFFPSSIMHEVLPVRCASLAFADSRFSVTGWIHK